MSKRIFTKEQINELLQNPNVLRCSEKSITYHRDFKVRSVGQYQDGGLSAMQIFKQAGFNVDIVGRDTPKESLGRWIKTLKKEGVDGFSKEQRGGPGRRRSLKHLTDQEKIEALELQNAYLKAENSFLVKLRAKQKR